MRARWTLLMCGLLAITWGVLHAGSGVENQTKLGEFATSLRGRTPGQRHNAILALNRLDGLTIEPGVEWSFNRTVGSWTRDQGYVKAPVSFSGQLLPSYGGGVCQTSTTLYNAALLAGLQIFERHRHAFAPNYVAPGRDAAVAYEMVDLKISNPYPFPVQLAAKLANDSIVVRIMTAGTVRTQQPEVRTEFLTVQEPATHAYGQRTGTQRVRNSGKPGFSVRVWREWSDRKELISDDVYPPMHRIVEGS